MFMFGTVGFSFSIYMMIKQKVDTLSIVKRALDVITITVPPALPTCMSIGIMFAMSCLKELKIFCTSPARVNVAGKVNIMCFDKTGTLTEEGLDTHGVLVSLDNQMQKLIPNQLIPHLKNHRGISKSIFDIMATCHSLTQVQAKLIGDPLELKMFESTQLILEDNNANKFDDLVLAIVKENEILNNNFNNNPNPL